MNTNTMPAASSPHQVLGLTPDASAKDIKKRYHELSLKHHPDKSLDNKEQANIQMVQINDAYQKMMASVASAKIDAHET